MQRGLADHECVYPMDYNGDGLDDLVVSSYQSDYLYVYLSTGDNLVMQMAHTLRDNPVHTFQYYWLKDYLKFTDLNGDGLADYLFCNMTDDTTNINWVYRLKTGDGFGPTHLTTVPCMFLGYFRDTIPMDINADGAMDLLIIA